MTKYKYSVAVIFKHTWHIYYGILAQVYAECHGHNRTWTHDFVIEEEMNSFLKSLQEELDNPILHRLEKEKTAWADKDRLFFLK